MQLKYHICIDIIYSYGINVPTENVNIQNKHI